ncbi:MAG: PilN domain-containing protein [Candidatus Zixiibacteriota bacterium]
MIEINLLPREFRKKPLSLSLGKSTVHFVVAIAAVLVILASLTFYQKHQINTLESNIQKARQRASMLEKDIKLVDALIDVKDKIYRRLSAVEQLDSHRSASVRILEEICRNVPEFVWLGHFKEKPLTEPNTQFNRPTGQKNKQPGLQRGRQPGQEEEMAGAENPWVRQAEIEGYAFTLNALASFMINIMRSDYFDQVELVSTNEVKLQDHKTYNFVLSCNLHYLSDEELQNLFAQASDQNNSRQLSNSHRGSN